jgi:hypothetical protein
MRDFTNRQQPNTGSREPPMFFALKDCFLFPKFISRSTVAAGRSLSSLDVIEHSSRDAPPISTLGVRNNIEITSPK